MSERFGKAYFDRHEVRLADPGVYYGIAQAVHHTFRDNWPVLEVGCGRGYVTRHLANLYGADAVLGADISEYACAHPLDGVRIERMDVSKNLLVGGRLFPLILSWQLLEHMEDEAAAWRAVQNLSGAGSFVQLHSIRVAESGAGEDETHTLMRPRAWWVGLFRASGWHMDQSLLRLFELFMNCERNPELFVLRRG